MSIKAADVLTCIRNKGSQWGPVGDEGPRRVGHCIHCKGRRCRGLTLQCEQRVFIDAELADQLQKDIDP